MRIKDTGNQGVALDLSPADCLMLAEACGLAAQCAMEHDRPGHAGPFDLGAAYFEALALIGNAYGHFSKGTEMDDWTLPRTIEAWGWLPKWEEQRR